VCNTYRVKRPEVQQSSAHRRFLLVDGGAAARSIGDRQAGAVAIVSAHAPAEVVAVRMCNYFTPALPRYMWLRLLMTEPCRRAIEQQ